MTDATTEPSEDEDSDLGYIKRIALAEPDTTLGKLQRGRGAGWLECLERPARRGEPSIAGAGSPGENWGPIDRRIGCRRGAMNEPGHTG